MTISVRLPTELEIRLNYLSEKTGRAKSFYIKAALEAYMEDLEDVLLANAILERVRSGKEKTHKLEDIENELKLDGLIN
ncbi:type II toxin-antitoxin system RelB family antitoxin [Testudinibacter sp. P80/BLE/0925]|uniref:type II toxin-antitoxin system RelB family antitoxin n=1 Tax=Testudinibacter sp. TW-1 TaxID=3417757 RepID=UPI003D36B585